MKINSYLVVLLLTLILFLNYNVASTGEKTVILEFFYTQGCSSCEKAKPIINQTTTNYSEKIDIIWYLVEDDPDTENYTYWKSYGFKYVPAVVVKNKITNNVTTINYDEITYDNVKDAIEKHLIEENQDDDDDTPIENGENNNNNNDKDIDIPGFELSIPLLAIIIVLFFRKKKNLQV